MLSLVPTKRSSRPLALIALLVLAFIAPTGASAATDLETLSAAVAGRWLLITKRPNGLAASTPPTLFCLVSGGASLTYDVEVSGDPDPNNGGAPAFPLDPQYGTSIGVSGSANFKIDATFWAVRAVVKTYTNGTLVCQLAQQ